MGDGRESAHAQLANGITVGAFPHYPNNPWQSMLYSSVEMQGATVIPFGSLEEVVAASQTLSNANGFVLHMNWTGAVTQRGDDVLQSMARTRALLAAVDRIRASGGHLVWTIHNVLPHETRFLLPELHLLNELASRASRIVIMNPATVAEMSAIVDLDVAKVVRIDHPSYLGRYPNNVGRAASRAHFGFGDDDLVALSLGAIRPYKNIELLSAAVAHARRTEPRLRLLVGGELGPGSDRNTLEAALRSVDARFSLEYVGDDDIQLWMNAADFAVFPYGHVLNTGALMLAATFGLPAAVTQSAATEELCAEEWVVPIPGELRTEDISQALLNAVQHLVLPGSVRSAALSFAAAKRPELISESFARLIRHVVE